MATGKVSFTAVVRARMAEALPSYRYVSTRGGSGPVVTFERPVPAKLKRFREVITFEKGLHGSTWFGVSLTPIFRGDAAGGSDFEHSLVDVHKLGPDSNCKSDDALDIALREVCAKVERKAKAFFGPFEKQYARYERLLAALVPHYTAWYGAIGSKLPENAFFDDDDNDDDGGTVSIPAFASFEKYVTQTKLTRGLKGNLDICLWRFWHGARPMREADYRKGDYYDCAKCGDFVARSRGKLVQKRDRHFGPCYQFECAKHAR